MSHFPDLRPGEAIVLTSPHFLQEAFAAIKPHLQPARRAGYEIGRVFLILDELLSNVYRHGYRRAAGRPIGMRLRVEADLCHIGVRDLAPVFDSAGEARQRALPEPESGAPGGRGLVIVHRMCESFQHRPGKNGGNELSLVLKMMRRSTLAPATTQAAWEPEDSHS